MSSKPFPKGFGKCQGKPNVENNLCKNPMGCYYKSSKVHESINYTHNTFPYFTISESLHTGYISPIRV